MSRRRSAALAAVLLHPTTNLHGALRAADLDETWDRFARHDPSLPEGLRSRFSSLDVDALMRNTERCGARIVIPGDEEWPVQLDDLGDARPWALWVRGGPLLPQRSVAIVGSRSCTSYGERISSEFAFGIADAGFPVVSGGAYGVDAAAHRGALASSTPTIAVLASGIDVSYPSAHAALFDRIVDGAGTLVSESPPGAHPTRQAFLIRNRVIAALSYGTVVIEARYRSGALSTCRHATELSRLVMGVPGPITSAESAGVHELLKAGAQVVTSAEDVLALVAPLGTVPGEVREERRIEWDELTRDERAVYEVFPTKGPTTVSEIRAHLTITIDTGSLLVVLSGLARRGLIAEALDGSWKRVRKPRGAES